MDAFVTVSSRRELVRGISGYNENLSGMPPDCSDPTVKVAQPRRMMNVSAYGCLCSRGPTPALVVDSKMIEILALPGSSS
jgi:hypothetical protein